MYESDLESPDVIRLCDMQLVIMRAHFPPNYLEELIWGQTPCEEVTLNMFAGMNIAHNGKTQILRVLFKPKKDVLKCYEY